MLETWKLLTDTIKEIKELTAINDVKGADFKFCIDDLEQVQRDLAVIILESTKETED